MNERERRETRESAKYATTDGVDASTRPTHDARRDADDRRRRTDARGRKVKVKVKVGTRRDDMTRAYATTSVAPQVGGRKGALVTGRKVPNW